MRRLLWVPALGVLVAVLVLWPEVPAWRIGGTASLPVAPASHETAEALCPAPGAIIELRGDSLVAGARMAAPTPEARVPYGRILETALGEGRQVVLNARGGATAEDGLQRLLPAAPRADVVILAFGTNDAAPRGWLGSKAAVPIADFTRALAAQIDAARSSGAVVILMAPPPAGSTAINRRIAPYRAAVRALARRRAISALDPAEAFARCPADEPVLVRDGLHLNVAGHRCVGAWLARKLCPPPALPTASSVSG